MLKQTIVDTGCGLKKWKLLIYLVVVDNSSNFIFTVPLETKYAITKTDAFSNVLLTSKKPKLLETDDGKEFATKLFQLLSKTSVKDYRVHSQGRSIHRRIY